MTAPRIRREDRARWVPGAFIHDDGRPLGKEALEDRSEDDSIERAFRELCAFAVCLAASAIWRAAVRRP